MPDKLYDGCREMVSMDVTMLTPKTITGKSFFFDRSISNWLQTLDEQVRDMWAKGELSPPLLLDMYQQVKIDELYHSNKIEGNSLTYGETTEIIETNIDILGKPSKDQQEARNLSAVLDYAHSLGADSSIAVTQNELRRIHSLLLHRLQDDAGTYRTTQLKITGSRYSPPEAFQVPAHMTALSDYVKQVTSPDAQHSEFPIFSAAAAHVWLAQIHPFTDGNGRTARALMNIILMRRGYPPCIITEEDRPQYIDALESSWESGNLTTFVELVHENINEQRENRGWLVSLQARLEQVVSSEVKNEYRIWRNAMIYLKSQFRHIVDNISTMDTLKSVNVKFAGYGPLTIEKYASLREDNRATKTWFFSLEFNGDGRRVRYLFFFGYPTDQRMKRRCSVILFIAKNTIDGYERLQDISQSSIPDVYQIGFDTDSREYVTLGVSGIRERNLVELSRQFFDHIFKRDFGI